MEKNSATHTLCQEAEAGCWIPNTERWRRIVGKGKREEGFLDIETDSTRGTQAVLEEKERKKYSCVVCSFPVLYARLPPDPPDPLAFLSVSSRRGNAPRLEGAGRALPGNMMIDRTKSTFPHQNCPGGYTITLTYA